MGGYEVGYMGDVKGSWLEEMVSPDVMGYLILPQGRHPKSFVFISLLEVC